MPRPEIPDLTTVAERALLSHLKADITCEARAAWHQIADRKVVSLVPGLEEMLAGAEVPVHQRLLALWSLGELGTLEPAQLQPLLSESHRALRREAARVLGSLDLGTRLLRLFEPLLEDPDPGVRAQIIQALDAISPSGPQVIGFLLRMVKPPLEEDPDSLRVFLNSPGGRALPLENRLLGCLALGDAKSALRLLGTVPSLKRNLSLEELMLIVSQVENSSVRKGFANLFKDPKQAESILRFVSLFSGRVPTSVREGTVWSSLLVPALRDLLARSRTSDNEELLLRLVSSFRLEVLEPEVLAILRREGQTSDRQLAALSTLLEIEFEQVEVFQELASDRRGW